MSTVTLWTALVGSSSAVLVAAASTLTTVTVPAVALGHVTAVNTVSNTSGTNSRGERKWKRNMATELPTCPKCESTNLRVNLEEHYTVCDDCGLFILAIPRYPF